MEVKLEDFSIDPKFKLLFESKMWTSGEDLVMNLERYKLVSREKIISILQEISGKSLLSYSSLPANLSETDHKYDRIAKESVLATKTDSGRIRYITNIFNEIDTNVLLISSPVPEFEVVYVTPFNWLDLNNKLPDWDYTILLKCYIADCMLHKGRDLHLTIETPGGKVTPVTSYRTPRGIVKHDLFKITEADISSMVLNLVDRLMSSRVKDLSNVEGVQGLASDIFGDNSTELRVSAFKIAHGYRAVCRIQHISTTTKTIRELSFPPEVTTDLLKIANKESGLTLITGKPNSGKNTTMFAMVNEISHKNIEIMGFFSPIEAWIPATLVDYQNSESHLENLVRLTKTSDTDVVLIGELPTPSVAKAARDLVNSSMHVFTTFHIDRVWHLPYKLLEFFGDGYKNMFSQMNACLNQKMFTHICHHCKTNVAVSELPMKYRTILSKYNVDFCKTSKGCEYCEKTERIQPYMERFLLTSKVVSDLLKCDEPYEMEDIIRTEMDKHNLGFEYQLSEAIRAGVLSYTALDSISKEEI